LLQDDWRIEYQRFAINEGVRLPMKWVASSSTAGVIVKVRVVIDRWHVDAASNQASY
jgi:hypothetical protein